MSSLIFPKREALRVVRAALAEDRAGRDLTTRAVIPSDLRSQARLVAREEGRAAGLPLLDMVFRALDRRCGVKRKFAEGAGFKAGSVLAEIRGPARALLSGERTALNLLARLCGIATLTSAYVREAAGRTRIYDTRKTTPGLRELEKYAVRAGGGWNHRKDLASAVLIKDNHAALAGDLATAILRARAAGVPEPLEAEASTLGQVREALACGAGIILLDNMSPALARRAMKTIGRAARVEISGGMSLAKIPAYAALRPERISVGALTHSARALDLSLDLG